MALVRVIGILEIDTRRGQLQFFKTDHEVPHDFETVEQRKALVVTGLGKIPSGFNISIQHMKGVSYFR